MELAYELRDLIGFLIAHARGRLIEQKQLGPQRQRHRDFCGALVAMRKLADEAVGFASKPNKRKRLFDSALDFCGLRAIDPGPQAITRRHFRADADVLV